MCSRRGRTVRGHTSAPRGHLSLFLYLSLPARLPTRGTVPSVRAALGQEHCQSTGHWARGPREVWTGPGAAYLCRRWAWSGRGQHRRRLGPAPGSHPRSPGDLGFSQPNQLRASDSRCLAPSPRLSVMFIIALHTEGFPFSDAENRTVSTQNTLTKNTPTPWAGRGLSANTGGSAPRLHYGTKKFPPSHNSSSIP